jgi:hypothetical protein
MWLILGRKRLPTPSASLLRAATVIDKEPLAGCLLPQQAMRYNVKILPERASRLVFFSAELPGIHL